MISFLTRTYPFKQSPHWLRDSIVYGVVIWAILFVLQPLRFSMYRGSKFLVAALFGLVTSGCYALYGLSVVRTLHARVKPWRIWHQAFTVLADSVYCRLQFHPILLLYSTTPITLRFFLAFLYWTMIIGIIITTLAIVIDYNRNLRDRMEELLSNTAEEQKDISVTISDHNVRGNDLTIPINDLLYVEAQKNNVSVCFVKDGKPQATEIHTTLTAVAEELKDYENIFQCHRSFIVNVNNITSARGNSNGYQLTLGTCTASIPVSRSYVPRLKSFIA